MKDLNALQAISVCGIIFSVAAQLLLIIFGKHVDKIWALYPTWIVVFIIGTILKKYLKQEDHHH